MSSDLVPGARAPNLQMPCAMHDDDDDKDDFQRPRPVRIPKKGTNQAEAMEAAPWQPLRKDDDRDRHRHVV